MSAPQTSANSNRRSMSFAGVIEKVLNNAGHNTVMIEPDITWTKENLSYYDTVLVGISPITSLSAHYTYGALNTIGLLHGTAKLKLFIDAPNPKQITSSFNAIKSWPDNLTKSFYSTRKAYSLAKTDEKKKYLLNVVDLLNEETWPTTLYPSLPWGLSDAAFNEVPKPAQKQLTAVNLDSHLLKKEHNFNKNRTARWTADFVDSQWTKKKLSTLKNPAIPMKMGKSWSDTQVEEQISNSIGALVSPQKNGTWWTYRYIQALNTRTPIATAWLESNAIGHSWAYLASTIEDMSADERFTLAKEQLDAYVESINTKNESTKSLLTVLGI